MRAAVITFSNWIKYLSFWKRLQYAFDLISVRIMTKLFRIFYLFFFIFSRYNGHRFNKNNKWNVSYFQFLDASLYELNELFRKLPFIIIPLLLFLLLSLFFVSIIITPFSPLLSLSVFFIADIVFHQLHIFLVQ